MLALLFGVALLLVWKRPAVAELGSGRGQRAVRLVLVVVPVAVKVAAQTLHLPGVLIVQLDTKTIGVRRTHWRIIRKTEALLKEKLLFVFTLHQGIALCIRPSNTTISARDQGTP